MADSQFSFASKPRSNSISQASESSQTAADFIQEQLDLEAEAREALPYQFDTCTQDLGAIRQSLYACLTCNPPPANSSDPHTPAGVCYSCSISCHGEHTLVELFNKRNFICDCGTTRLPETAPCTLRINSKTGQKGDVTGETPAASNKYNHNFRNKFCGCGEDYDAHQEKGTMFQCLGLGTVEDGGCGEDWWHPECLVGLSRDEWKLMVQKSKEISSNNVNGEEKDSKADASTETAAAPEGDGAKNQAVEPAPVTAAAITAAVTNGGGVDGNDIAAGAEEEDEDDPLPPGFPAEDDFDHFICYKCLEGNPWIKTYAGSPGFLAPVYHDKAANTPTTQVAVVPTTAPTNGESKKRKASDDDEDPASNSLVPPTLPKRQKSEDPSHTLPSIPEDSTAAPALPTTSPTAPPTCRLPTLPPLPPLAATTPFSLFLTPTFRTSLCRCPTCFPHLAPHPQLLDEEDTYEPPLSTSSAAPSHTGSLGTGSLLSRGEAALHTMDRVRALQGAMAYAHLREKVSEFLKPFAESGRVVGAEDVKGYFERLRGDEGGIKEARGRADRDGEGSGSGGDGGDGVDGMREQKGF